VFINVIVNALESLPDRGRSVTVSAGLDRDGRRIIVSVADQGKGIAEDVLAQIGEPFFTTKADTGRHRAGSVDLVVDRRKTRRTPAL
jgi:two-component system NtrC family sensor kinase